MQNPVPIVLSQAHRLLLILVMPSVFSHVTLCITDCKDKVNLLNQNKNYGKIYIFY